VAVNAYCRAVTGGASPGGDRVPAAEVIAALSLATDMGLGIELEHGLRSTLIAMRLAERLGVDRRTAVQTYYACLLTHVGCTTNAHVAAEVFGDGSEVLSRNLLPVLFGSSREMTAALVRSVAPTRPPAARAMAFGRALPKALRAGPEISAAAPRCEVAEMLVDRLGIGAGIGPLFAHLQERWDGKGDPGRAQRDEIPLAMRIAHVARDADAQCQFGGSAHALTVVRRRAGHAFDPAIAECFTDAAAEIAVFGGEADAWAQTLACEPGPPVSLEGDAIDGALAAIGDFADLASPYLVGHSAGVAQLASAAAATGGVDVRTVRRAALVHDVGRVAVPVRVWQKPGPLTAGEWERVRLHAYHSERVLCRSPFLEALTPVATAHHERLDGSGYHRGIGASGLAPAARLLAAADAYHAMLEPRPHRAALTAQRAAEMLVEAARAGRLDADAVAAVLDATGQPAQRIERPAGLTDREAQVIGLLARGLQTKQVARALAISPKTADTHVQNAYRKIGVSTRAAATLFAMHHGLVASGELPMAGSSGRP
jgi:HD-GYP domain-containing protein (c-di-GMP phosphodiesterase class II)